MQIPLIDIYPLVYKPFDMFAQFRKEPEALTFLPPVEIGFTISDPVDHAHRAVNLHNNLLPSLIEEKLSSLQSFKAARAVMPRLQDIPAIRKYRNSYPHYDAVGVDDEIATYGHPLHPGQVLFHGGAYPRDEMGWPLEEFNGSEVFSTSLCAQVAATHSSYHTPKDVWIVRIASRSTTKAIIFGHKRQTLGHEREVLLAKNVQFTLREIHSDGEYTLYEVDAL